MEQNHDTIKTLLAGSGGFIYMMTNADIVFKVLIGAATLFYVAIKIIKELKK